MAIWFAGPSLDLAHVSRQIRCVFFAWGGSSKHQCVKGLLGATNVKLRRAKIES